jgi:hypothetical protein
MSRDSHSRNGNSADEATDNLPGPSLSQPPASYANNSSFSHSNSQHNSHNMSTLAHAAPRTSFVRNTTAVQRGEHLPEFASLIPRSALHESGEAILEDGISRASSLLEIDGYRSLDIDKSLVIQLSQSMDATRDGKVTKLITQFEAHAGSGHSDVSQVSHDDQVGARTSARDGSLSGAVTVRGPSSPRKPIPSQWLPFTSGPNLATAQRAKEREHKKGSLGGSLSEPLTLRGTRGLADIGRTHGAEGAAFLTKTTHAAVESDFTSPKSPTKGHRASSKPAWNSPTSREHLQQPNLIIKTSPIKRAFLSAEAASHGHRRGTSVATSAGDTVYHSAESSPVWSTADLSPSPESIIEAFSNDDHHIPDLQLGADSGYEQVIERPSLVQVTTKAATVGRGSQPRIRIDIPPTNPRSDVAGEAFCMSNSPWNPSLASSVSRIPRVAITNTTSVHSPTRSSTLKRAQSVKSLSSPTPKLQIQGQNSHNLQPSTPPKTSVRHVRTVNSSGTTPILARHPASEHVHLQNSASTKTKVDSLSFQDTQFTIEHGASRLGATNLVVSAKAADTSDSRRKVSTASSVSTVKATPVIADPVLVDSAIIYSKKSGASGMPPPPKQAFDIPPFTVMMAHGYDIGTFRQNGDHGDVATATSSFAHNTIQTLVPVRGRAEQFIPNARRQGESEHSLQSNLASDLRATAPEFVPRPPSPGGQDDKNASPTNQIDPTTDLLGPRKYELDMYGIPWYYYMYQVQFAYNQGFQKGRSKSPKKTRQKKHRLSVSSLVDAPYEIKANGAAASFTPGQEHQSISDMPPPASTVSLSEQRAQKQRDNLVDVVSSTETRPTDRISITERPFSPFAAQKEMIDRQNAFRDFAVTDRLPVGVDLTTIRNVGLPQNDQPNTMPNRSHNYNGPRRHNRSDNRLYTYRGRGVAGIRIQDTVPFPSPVPPQGRPTRSIVGSEACGTIDIVYAAERIGGEACHDCEPDHPLE